MPLAQLLANFQSLPLLPISKLGPSDADSPGGGDSWQGGNWQTRQSHVCVQINWKEQLGSETDHATQGSSVGK